MSFTILTAWDCDGAGDAATTGMRCVRRWSADLSSELGWEGIESLSSQQLRDIGVHDASEAGWTFPDGTAGPARCPACTAIADGLDEFRGVPADDGGSQLWELDGVWLRTQIENRRTNADIAAELGCSPATVSAAVAGFGLGGIRSALRPTIRNAKLADREWLQQRVDHDSTILQIAEAAGASERTVTTWLHRHGIERPSQHVADGPIADRGWVAARIADDETATSIADDAGVSTSTVTSWIRRHGLDKEWTDNKTRRKRTFPELADRDWLREQLQAGADEAALAEQLGCAMRTVQNALRSYQFRGPLRATSREKRLAVQRHLDGESIQQIATSLRRKHATVAHWVVEAGHQPSLAKYSDDDRQQILARIESGESVRAVGVDTGVDATTIRAWRRAANG